jgi:hypothetical protein
VKGVRSRSWVWIFTLHHRKWEWVSHHFTSACHWHFRTSGIMSSRQHNKRRNVVVKLLLHSSSPGWASKYSGLDFMSFLSFSRRIPVPSKVSSQYPYKPCPATIHYHLPISIAAHNLWGQTSLNNSGIMKFDALWPVTSYNVVKDNMFQRYSPPPSSGPWGR